MSTCTSAQFNPSPRKLIGEILEEAGLISSPQLETALTVQSRSSHFPKLGEIITSQGWLKQKTIDFLVDVFSVSDLSKYLPRQPIGYYLKEAGLLSQEQIDSIMEDQQRLGIKFCYLAVIKGFLRPKTADFFLDSVAQIFASSSTQVRPVNQNQDDKVQTVMLDNNSYEEIVKEQDLSLNEFDDELSLTGDSEIQSSPIWIDK